MKQFAFSIILFAALLSGTSAIAQPICDFSQYSPTPYLQTWTDNNGNAYSTWAAGSQNWEIIPSNIKTPPVPKPYVLHTNPGNGAGSQSPQWLISQQIQGFYFLYNELQWTFWMGRRANNGQNGGNQDRSTVWLYVNNNTSLTNLTGLEGIRVTWHHNSNKDAVQLVEVYGGVEHIIGDFVLLDNLSNYEWGCTFVINRIPSGTPTGSQVRWQLRTSTPDVNVPNFSTYSLPASADPIATATYLRIDSLMPAANTWLPSSTTGRMGFMSDFAVSRKDAAEYNQICFLNKGNVPVELTGFNASYRNDQVVLNWKTATELNNFGFEIERSTGNFERWESIGFVEGHGTTNAPQRYMFIDIPKLDGANTVAYRLRQIDGSGVYTFSDAVFVTLAPESADMLYNFPNPFNPVTNISFNLQKDDVVTLKIFNAAGETVATLFSNEALTAGSHSAPFNGANLPSGTYFYRLITSEGTMINRMVLSK